jgi:hypothetical protein
MILILVFKLMFHCNAVAVKNGNDLQQVKSPYVVGSTLHIVGKIDSHIYDYLSYAGESLNTIEWVSLNSFGGKHDWALAIANKLQALNIKTRIQPGSVCASSCVYLFMAGQERWMHQSTWLGVHGARLGLQYRIEFLQKCAGFTPVELNLPGECEQILAAWYKVSYDATAEAFLWMQTQGASKDILNIYMGFEDMNEWLEEGNVLRKPDWVIPARDALSLSLATHLF